MIVIPSVRVTSHVSRVTCLAMFDHVARNTFEADLNSIPSAGATDLKLLGVGVPHTEAACPEHAQWKMRRG